MLGSPVAEHVFVSAIAGPEDRKLEVEACQRRQRLLDQLQALLFVEPGDEGDHGRGAVCQAQLRSQRRLVQGLWSGLISRVVMRDGRIRGGVEDLDVDAVDDPIELVGVTPQQLVQALSELWRLDLFRVALAYRVHHVGEVDAAAKEVDDVVQVGNADLDQAPTLELGQPQCGRSELTLEGKVVKGQNGRYPG